MFASQSRTLEAAIKGYQKRYGRDPPPSFDQWYKLAVEWNVTVIDEYDTVMASFEPFWGISAREMRARVREVLDKSHPNIFLKELRIKDHVLYLSEEPQKEFWPEMVKDRIQSFLQHLPDMEIPWNLYDEPKVVVPHDVLQRSVTECASPSDHGRENAESPESRYLPKVYFNDVTRQRCWDFVIRSCPLDSPSRSELSSIASTAMGSKIEAPRFHLNTSRMNDVCELPQASTTFAMFATPDSSYYTSTLVPVFSRARPSSFQDLFFPGIEYSAWLSRGKYESYKAADDPPWEEKQNRLYWAGTTSDGRYIDDRWKQAQRVRTVRELNDNNRRITLLNQNQQNGSWEPYESTMKSLSDHVRINSAPMNPKNCDSSQCDALKSQENGLVFREGEASSVAYGNRFVMDIDGKGYTERFYRLMQSKSVVFKMTLLKEWWEDFLIPWMHYVPISLGMEELPETLRFLSESERGQEIAKEISEEGHRWVAQTWRDEDMKIATFRILLEYARLWDEGRDRRGECPANRK